MTTNYILGLDIGANSVGWAAIRDAEGASPSILGTGVRVFEEGVNLDARTGKTESRNVKRREARMRRRQVHRHALRKRQVRQLLQAAGLLPPGVPDYADTAWRAVLDTNPYKLRAEALNRPLGGTELGRVFYHLAERRGFQSNRKRPPKDEDHGKVKDDIRRVEAEWKASGARTIGEYFSRLNPHQARIRTNHTLRAWFKEEFEQIWQHQAAHHAAVLTTEWRKTLWHRLFDQRPLKSQAHLLGHCELEPSKRRAPMALLESQEFRLLQDLNHLRMVDGSGNAKELSSEQREALLALLQTTEKVTFPRIRKEASLKGCKFNMEEGERKHLTGNSTAARIREILGARWDAMPHEDRRRFVNDLMSLSEEALDRRLREHWGLDAPSVQAFVEDVVLEDDYCALSSFAIAKLLPHLRAGLPYTTAVLKEKWPGGHAEALRELPELENLRNPIVQRALGETRRVVNAIVRKFGRPNRIQVELARELKLNKDDRAEYIQNMRRREAERSQARTELIKAGITNPNSHDIEKWLLLHECNGRCPYTNRQIGFEALFHRGEFDVEHIIPISRSLDDSFANKTLCHGHANRVVKRDRTPFEIYGNTPEWADIMDRVNKFTGPFAREKQRRFEITDVSNAPEFLDQFTARQLNDTRYAARRAIEYVGLLYPETERLTRVGATNGRATAHLRGAWGLNRVLSDGPRKSRDDHRHHAVDAICVALTTSRTIQMLAAAATSWAARSARGGVFRGVPHPWPSFEQDVRKAISEIVVSHRVSRKVSGPLHEETHYGLIRDPHDKAKRGSVRAVIRKRIVDLSSRNIDDIVDPAVREAVRTATGGEEPRQAFKDAGRLPALRTRAGESIPIKKVRLYAPVDSPVELSPCRRVKLGGNHHLEVSAGKRSDGTVLWRGTVISLLEAYTRVAKKTPLYWKDLAPNRDRVFSLVQGDTIRCTYKGDRELLVITTISEGFYECRRNHDARPATVIRAAKDRIIFSDKSLRDGEAEKLSVSPIGETRRSRD